MKYRSSVNNGVAKAYSVIKSSGGEGVNGVNSISEGVSALSGSKRINIAMAQRESSSIG